MHISTNHSRAHQKQNYLEEELYALVRTNPVIFQFLQNATLDGLWYWDLENPEQEWMNAKFWQLLGFSAKEKKHLASEWQNLIHPDDLAAAIVNLNKHIEDPDHPYEQIVRYTHADGSTVWVQCRGMAIRDEEGKAIRLLGAHNDITRLKQTEEELLAIKENLEQRVEERTRSIQHTKNQMQSILDHVADAIIVFDDQKHVKYWSRSAQKIFGYSRKNIIENNITAMIPAIPEIIKSLKLSPGAADNDDREYRECSGITEDEQTFPIDISITKTGINSHTEYVCIVRDISERKKIEEQLKQTAEREKQANVAKSVFLANMSHEFRTPMNAIMGYSELLCSKSFSKLSTEKVKEYLQDIQSASSHLLALIDDILDLSRIEAGKESSEPELISVGDLMRNLLDIIQVLADKSGIHIINKISPDIMLFADAKHMRQILINLLSNAIKYNRENGQIIISAQSNALGNVQITVQDFGLGMTKEETVRAFKPFERTESATLRCTSGSGLGLSLVDKLTKLNGGSVKLDSRSGKGTTVTLEFGAKPISQRTDSITPN